MMNRREFLFQQAALGSVVLTSGPGLSQVEKGPHHVRNSTDRCETT